jgi:hypothetical protein
VGADRIGCSRSNCQRRPTQVFYKRKRSLARYRVGGM